MSKYHKKKTFDQRMLDIPSCFGVKQEYNIKNVICASCKYNISCAAHIISNEERKKVFKK